MMLLFDLDNTLTLPRQKASREMVLELKRLLRCGYRVGVITGSPLAYVKEQLPKIDGVFLFPCNGTQVYHVGGNELFETFRTSMFNKIVNGTIDDVKKVLFDLHARMTTLPCACVGEIVQVRESMINFCPIGRNAGVLERQSFVEYDKRVGFRQAWLGRLRNRLKKFGLKVVLGGETSFDIFPEGWDKSYVLYNLKSEDVLFFGDSFHKDGNDACLLGKVACVHVRNPAHTLELLRCMK